MRNLKIYAPGGDNADGGDEGFTDLTQLKGDPIVIDTPADDDPEKTPEEIAAEKAAAKAKAADAKSDDAPKDDDDADGKEPILKIENADDPEEEVSDWTEVGTALGFQVAENTQEALKAGFETYLEKVKSEAQAATAETNIFEKYGEAGVNLFKTVAATGDSIEAILNPLLQFDEVLAWEDEDKVVTYYKQQGLSEERAKALYAKDVENGTVEDLITKIDTNIINGREAKQQEILTNGAKKYDDIISLQNKEAKDQITKASEELSKRTDFLGIKIDQDSMKVIIKRMDAGLYRKAIMSDPKLLADFALSVEFGKKVVKDSGSVAVRKAKGETLENLANLETVKKASGKASANAAPASSGNHFDSWKLPAEGEVKVVSVAE